MQNQKPKRLLQQIDMWAHVSAKTWSNNAICTEKTIKKEQKKLCSHECSSKLDTLLSARRMFAQDRLRTTLEFAQFSRQKFTHCSNPHYLPSFSTLAQRFSLFFLPNLTLVQNSRIPTFVRPPPPPPQANFCSRHLPKGK